MIDHLCEKAPPGEKAERFIRKHKKSFQKRYGDNWERILYGRAWKQFGESASFREYLDDVELESILERDLNAR